jgi:transposase-like protein
MARKGQKFQQYTSELKAEAVRLYEEEGVSYQTVADQLGIKSRTQVKQWVKKHRNHETLEDKRGKGTVWRKGRPKTKFASIEGELAYIKAENEYLKEHVTKWTGETSPFLFEV